MKGGVFAGREMAGKGGEARTSGNGGPASLIAQLPLGHGAFERRPRLTQDQLAERVGSRTLAGSLFARLGRWRRG